MLGICSALMAEGFTLSLLKSNMVIEDVLSTVTVNMLQQLLIEASDQLCSSWHHNPEQTIPVPIFCTGACNSSASGAQHGPSLSTSIQSVACTRKKSCLALASHRLGCFARFCIRIDCTAASCTKPAPSPSCLTGVLPCRFLLASCNRFSASSCSSQSKSFALGHTHLLYPGCDKMTQNTSCKIIGKVTL